MFSPRAENLDMPGRLPAAPRSRWAKLSVLAMCADQSPATRARSSSQSRAARPRARRSALSRLNRSLASFWAVDRLPAGGARGGAGGGGAARPPLGPTGGGGVGDLGQQLGHPHAAGLARPDPDGVEGVAEDAAP